MIAEAISSGLRGVKGFDVKVQTFISRGLPAFIISGLPGQAIKESKDRVKAAIITSGYKIPPSRITVNLLPANERKEGSGFDLSIAIAILQGSSQVNMSGLENTMLLGELSLNGDLVPISGCLPMAISAMENGINNIIVPFENAEELNCLQDLHVYPARTLNDVANHLSKEKLISPIKQRDYDSLLQDKRIVHDLIRVKGQFLAKTAIETAAAGGHNMIMIGVPGSGKTMLARCLPGILPTMSFEEAIETTRIHSSAGNLPTGSGILTLRPFRSPHHSASVPAIIGGGAKAKPGEISLAHNGVLFLDEFPEYSKRVLEALRQPLEDGTVTVSRIGAREEYPANIMLIASMNPCPCGNFGSRTKKCTCTDYEIQRYLNKISGPLLDRMDIQVEMDSVSVKDLESTEKAENSRTVRERVINARKIQQERYKGLTIHNNAQLDAELLEKYCILSPNCKKLLNTAIERYGMSLRGRARIIKVARTLADIKGKSSISVDDIAKALQFRNLEGRYWR